MSNTGIRVHGAITLNGPDSEIHNLEIEQVADDPITENINTLWYNTKLSKMSYSELVNLLPTVRRIASDLDISNLITQINSLANETNIAIGNAISSISQELVINNTLNTLLIGQPVYYLNDGSISLANAVDINKKDVIGFIINNNILGNGGAGQLALVGKVTATEAQWSMVTDNFSALVPNSNYFLSIYDGKITNTPPLDIGLFCCLIGKALSTTELNIKIDRAISL